MILTTVHDRDAIASFLRQNIAIHLYALGDLDEFFWPYTNWYALVNQDNQIQELVLLYRGGEIPVLLAHTTNPPVMRDLLSRLLDQLPQKFYIHINEEAAGALSAQCNLKALGLHYQMSLINPSLCTQIATSDVQRLQMSDLPAIETLYQAGYDGNWFDQRMLASDHYFGIWQDEMLVSIAGIHVYSPQYRVATLGNVTTHPAYRGQGLSKRVCAKLCQELLQTTDHIGLNVKADNQQAIALYQRLGFAYHNTYDEFMCYAVTASEQIKNF